MKISIAFLSLVFALGCSSLENCAMSSTVVFDSFYIPYLYSMPHSSSYASDYFAIFDRQFLEGLDDSFFSVTPLMSVGSFSCSSPASCSSCHE